MELTSAILSVISVVHRHRAKQPNNTVSQLGDPLIRIAAALDYAKIVFPCSAPWPLADL